MILALARPSEPWWFPAGSCFFSKLFYCQQYCQQLQATESRQKGVFSRISAFFEAVLLLHILKFPLDPRLGSLTWVEVCKGKV